MAQADALQQTAQQIQQLLSAGRTPQALSLGEKLARRYPADSRARQMLGALYRSAGRTAEAVTEIETAVRLAPTNPALRLELARTYFTDHRLDEAVEAVDKALEPDPRNAACIGFKADLLFVQAKYEEARDLLSIITDGPQPHPALLLSMTNILVAMRRHDEAEEVLQRFMRIPGTPIRMRAEAAFRMARIQDARKQYDEAFATVKQANALRDVTFDAPAISGLIRDMMRIWTRERIAELPRALTASNEQPVFIVGMPRSGTSLVEQILASHPAVFGAGELPDIGAAVLALQGEPATDPVFLTNVDAIRGVALIEAGRRYLKGIESFSADALRITDKMPLNFLHLGLIALLFPKARVIYCKRDPVDTCISCYFQDFAGSNPFAYNLTHLGKFHRGCEQLMAHWKQVLDIPILDVVYEDVVDDLEGQARRMIEFLGLDWDEGCLRFHETGRATMTASSDQVRRPLYKTSVNRREHYRKHIEPLLQALEAAER